MNKRSLPKLRWFCCPKSGDLKKKAVTFSDQLYALSKTKLWCYDPNHSKSFTTSDRQSPWGGYFHFWSKIRPQNHLKRSILHTFQANGGTEANPAPPLATRSYCWLVQVA